MEKQKYNVKQKIPRGWVDGSATEKEGNEANSTLLISLRKTLC